MEGEQELYKTESGDVRNGYRHRHTHNWATNRGTAHLLVTTTFNTHKIMVNIKRQILPDMKVKLSDEFYRNFQRKAFFSKLWKLHK